jgi:hypothetical protein
VSEKKDLLTADEVEGILGCDDRQTVDLYVPEWKRTVRIRQLSAADSLLVAESPKLESMLLIVALSVVDESGARLFKDHERLKAKSAGALNLIQNAALRLNGFSADAAAAAKNA